MHYTTLTTSVLILLLLQESQFLWCVFLGKTELQVRTAGELGKVLTVAGIPVIYAGLHIIKYAR